MFIKKSPRRSQSGFTLIETLIAVVILSGGLLALASAFSQGMVIMLTAHSQQIAKEKAAEAIESVFTSRDTRIITWAQVQNAPNGIFLAGPQTLRRPGPDGLVNTADDAGFPVDTELQPGDDNVLGTPDDVLVPLSNFTRDIQIVNVGNNLRQITVVIRYTVSNFTRQYQLSTYISSFS